MEKSTSSDPPEHTANKKEFRKLSEHFDEDLDKLNDPQAKGLFEVSQKLSMFLKKLL